MTGVLRQVSIAGLTALMLASNLLSGQGGGFVDKPGERSVYFLYPTEFSPAPFTFLIWLPIFVGAVALAVFQALPAQRANAVLDRLAWPYAIALGANAMTPFAGLGLSNLLVLVLFLALLACCATLLHGPHGGLMRQCVVTPIFMFATWAGLATIVNACQLKVALGGTVGEVTAAALVILAMGLGAWAVFRTGQWIIAAVMAWAGIGLAATNADAPLLLAVIVLTTAATLIVALRYRGPSSLSR